MISRGFSGIIGFTGRALELLGGFVRDISFNNAKAYFEG